MWSGLSQRSHSPRVFPSHLIFDCGVIAEHDAISPAFLGLLIMNSHARVLVVSRDEMLLRSREMILGAFFAVRGAGRFVEARSLLTSNSFDLIVLCHSLTADECERLASMARERAPRCQVLAMSSTSRGSVKPWADKQLGVDAGPYGLLKKCAEMLGFVLKSKARATHAAPQAVSS